MPQMAPINWLILFILFFLCFLIFNILNFFCLLNKKEFLPKLINNSNMKSLMNNKIFLNKMNWKW